jgi:hypothetical protein
MARVSFRESVAHYVGEVMTAIAHFTPSRPANPLFAARSLAFDDLARPGLAKTSDRHSGTAS